MRVLKKEHACLVLTNDDESLVIDPGNQTSEFEVEHLTAIVITHAHPDHWEAAHLTRLQQAHPDAPIYAPEGVVEAANGFDITVVRPGEEVTIGAFTLRFFGGKHAVIHPSIPVIDNVGVLVNRTLYYPGDSYALPFEPVEVLATPAGAPWLKVSEVMDFVMAVRPKQTFATHVGTLSEMGLGFANDRIRGAVEEVGGTHRLVTAGDSFDVAERAA
ncbi:MBL fold metallo-hydrolase [Humidisolicoccus flavus]|uniref:MBL fold metallo-hydrolase n=1 Tax=Humidisolicoccus flavus TaxID=3111414 RepID=UPI003244BCD5